MRLEKNGFNFSWIVAYLVRWNFLIKLYDVISFYDRFFNRENIYVNFYE